MTALRHEWTTAAGHDLAIVAEDGGAVRLERKASPPGDPDAWVATHYAYDPHTLDHALLALAAELLREREEVRAALNEAVKTLDGATASTFYAPTLLREWCEGFDTAKLAVLAILGNEEP
jgi:hypothetical protein